MSKKRRGRKRKGGQRKPSVGQSQPSGGGLMQRMAGGFKAVAGGDTGGKKPSTLSNVIWTILLVAAVGFLIYRYTR